MGWATFWRKLMADETNRRKKGAPGAATPLKSTLLSLEQRLMFDAAAAATTAEVASEQVAQEQANAAVSPDADTTRTDAALTESEDLFQALTTFLPADSPTEIVFVDPTVPDYQTLLAGMDPAIEVVVLDGGQDGIEQIAGALFGRTGIDAIHLISHGEAGELHLGTGVLTAESMSSTYADTLATIRQALSENADILVYGCDFSKGDTGQRAVERLADLTGADVQASNDSTGHSSLGGDWDLEVRAGSIETQVAIADQTQLDWVGVLAETWMNAGTGAVIAGPAGNDWYVGDSANNTPSAAGGGADIMYGAEGDDTLQGGSGNDILVGGTGNDTISGNSDDDVILGGAGNDYLDGGSSVGKNTIIGGGGNDQMVGGSGADVFRFTGAQSGDAYTVDGAGGTDIIDLSEFSTATITNSGGVITVDRGSGNVFTITHSNVESIITAATVGNHGPLADAGVDQAVALSATVTLTAAGSSDRDGNSLTYQWTQIEGPKVTLSSSTAASPTFTAPGSATTLQFVVVVSDGITSHADIVAITVGASEQVPVNTVPGAQTTSEDTNLIFSSGNGNQLSITDPNGSSGTIEVTLSVTSGAFTLAGTTGLTFVAGDGTADATMTLRGTVTNINNALNGASFSPTANYSGGAALTIATRDSTLVSLDIDANLQARYTFEGNANDVASGTAQNGTLTNGASIVTDGIRGQVLSLDGVNDYVDLSAHTADFAGFTQGTIGGWIKATGTLETIFSISDTADTGSYAALFLGASGYLTYEVMENGVMQLAVYKSDVAINDGNWHHVAISIGPSGNVLYVDGAAATSGQLTYDTGNTSTQRFFSSVSGLDSMAIGRNQDSSGGKWYATGSLDDVRIYNRALSATEVSSVANDLNFTDTDTVAITVTAQNDGPSFGSLNGTPTYTEGGSAVVLDSNVTITDTELTAANNFNAATLTVSRNGGANSQDVFSASGTLSLSGGTVVVGGTTIGTYTNSGGTLAMTFNSSATNTLVNSAMQQIAYSNSSDAPPSSVQIDWTFSDGNSGSQGSGGALSATGSVTVSISAVNDAPVLADTALTLTVAEDAGAPSGAVGSPVSAFTGGVTDVDSGASKGIAITGSDETNGTWYYTTNNGSTWTAVGTVSNTSALLLADNANTRLYFSPGANFNGTSSGALTVRAWDQTSGAAGSKVSTASNGGTTAFSSATDVVDVTVTAVNDAPVLVPQGLIYNTAEGAAPITSTVATLIGSSVTDVDSGALSGVAIFGMTGSGGTLEYSLDGSTWLSAGALSSSNALLLRSTDQMRFTPDSNNGGTIQVSYRAWDQTTGSAGSKVDVSVTGGSTAFSSASDVASCTIASANDAPVLADTALTLTVAEDAGAPSGPVGSPVSAFTGGVTDVDSGASKGIAITGSNETNGTWYYTTNNGSTWTAVGTVSNTSALLLADNANTRLYFAPKANYSGSSTAALTVRAWDQTSGTAGTKVTAASNGGTTAFSSATDTINVTVTPVNDAPVFAATNDATVLEGGSVIVSSKHLSATDVDSGASALQYTITGLPTNGALLLKGVRLSLRDTFTQADIDNGILEYVHDGSETTADSFDFVVEDDAGGSIAESTFKIVVTAVNDAPTDLALSANTVAENAANGTVVGTITGSDADAGDTKRYAFTDSAGGRFAINSSTGQITVANSSLLNYESATSHNVTVRVTDSGGLTYDETFTITVTNVNEAPTGADTTVTISEDTSHTLTTADFGFSDADAGDSLSAVRIDTVPGAGTVTLSGVAVTNGQVIAVSDITAGNLVFTPAADGNGVGYASVTFSVRDSTNAYDASSNTLTFDVAPVNDAPIRTSGTVSNLTVSEDAGFASLGLAGVTYSNGGSIDESGQTLAYAVTAIPSPSVGDVFLADGTTRVIVGSYTLAEIQGMQFKPAMNATGVTAFQFNVYDSGGTANGGADTISEFILITVNAVNDTPTITNLSGDSLSYDEGDGTVVIEQDGNALVADIDSTNFDTGTLTLSFASGSDSAEDVLGIQNQGTGAGQIGVSGSIITYGGTTIGTFAGGSGGTNLVITLNGSATPTAVTALIKDITYENTDTSAPTTGARTVRYVLTDGDGGTSANYDTTVTVNGVNDAPVNTVPGAQTVNEDTALPLSGISVTDMDGNLSTVQLGVLNGTVSVTVQGGATISAGSNGSGTLTLSGSQADINATLATLVYQGTPNYTGADTLTVTSTDAGSVSDVDTVAITVTGQNDAPTDLVLSANTVAENAANGTVVGTISGTDLDTGDTKAYTFTDSAGGRFAINSTTGEITVADGTLLNYEAAASHNVTVRVTDSGGLTYDETFTITLTDVNEAPTALTLSANTVAENAVNGTVVGTISTTDPDAGDSHTYSLTDTAGGRFTINSSTGAITVADGSLLNYESATSHPVTVRTTDAGGLTCDQTFTITLTDVNEAPTGADATITLLEDTPYTLTPADFGFSDVDAGDALSAVRLDSLPAAGTLTLSGGAVTAGQVITAADLAAGRLVFTPTADANGPGYASVTFSVQDSHSAYAATPSTLVFDVTAVNDAPILMANTGSTVTEGGTDTISSGELSVTDADESAAQLTFSIGTGPAHGRLELTTAPGVSVSTFTQADIAANRVIYVHDGSETTSDSISVTVSDGAGGSIGSTTVTLTVTPVNDAPTITSDGGGATAAVNVAEHISAVTIVGGADVDLPAQALSYSISGGVDQALFTVDGATGALSFVAPPDFEVPIDANGDNVYVVQVRVTDTQGGSVTQTLQVTVTDVPESRVPVPLPPSLVPTTPPAGTPVPPPASAPVPPTAAGPVSDSRLGPLPTTLVPSRGVVAQAAQGSTHREEFRPDDLRRVSDSVAREEFHVRVSDQPPASSPLTLLIEASRLDGPEERPSPAELSELLFAKLDEVIERLEEAVASETEDQVHVTRIAAASGVTLSVGFVVWALRSTALLTSLFATIPAWQMLDPLPVVASHRQERLFRTRAQEKVSRDEQVQYRGLRDLLDEKGEQARRLPEA